MKKTITIEIGQLVTGGLDDAEPLSNHIVHLHLRAFFFEKQIIYFKQILKFNLHAKTSSANVLYPL